MKDIHIKYLENNENIDYYFITFNEDMIVDVEINNNIIYIKGEENIIPDILSRRSDYGTDKNKKESGILLEKGLFVNSVLVNKELSVEALQDFGDLLDPAFSDSEEIGIVSNPENTTG